MAGGEPCRGQSNQRLLPCCRAVQCADGLCCRAPVPPSSLPPRGGGTAMGMGIHTLLLQGVQPSSFGCVWECPWQRRQRMQGCMEGCYGTPRGQHPPPMTGTATPLPSRQLLVHCTAQPEVGLLLSEGWRQGLGTSR